MDASPPLTPSVSSEDNPLVSPPISATLDIPSPHCVQMSEHPSAESERDRLRQGLLSPTASPLALHLSYGLAYTAGSAVGSTPPSAEACLEAFLTPNKVGLTAGARAWSKHAHRSIGTVPQPTEAETSGSCEANPARGKGKKKDHPASGWWGAPLGPVVGINEKALSLFWRVTNGATWKNLHWLPHSVLVYEARVPEGYGMRWSQDRSAAVSCGGEGEDNGAVQVDEDVQKALLDQRSWVFRGFVEPMMENGHEVGWRH